MTLEQDEILGVEKDLNFFELTDLFYAYYKYHNEDYLMNFDYISSVTKEGNAVTKSTNLSRYDSLRKIEIMRLGGRPFLADKGRAPHKTNISLGYMSLLLNYLALPYKAIFTDSDLVKVRINKRLYDEENLSDKQKEQQRLEAQNNPNVTSNKEVSDNMSDAYSIVLKLSKDIKKCSNLLPLRIVQDGVAALTYSDLSYKPKFVCALDLVSEPYAETDVSTWNSFFVIRKLPAVQAIKHIREETKFWNIDALRWALESSYAGKGIINGRHYGSGMSGEPSKADVCGENFSVKSFYSEKALRTEYVSSYYGNILVAEGYYMNKKGKINHVIFFPSQDAINVPAKDRQAFLKGELKNKTLKNAGILFFRQDVFKSMEEAITVFPIDPSEPVLERQRGYGHELYGPLDSVMRVDTSVIDTVLLMSTIFFKNLQQGTNAQDMLDLEIDVGNSVDLGDREFVQSPFVADLQGMLGVRQIMLQHAASKSYLGGLDGIETLGATAGKKQEFANMRLVRDGSIHKHSIAAFADRLTVFYTNVLRKILILNEKNLLDKDNLIKYKFFKVLIDVHKHPEELFEIKEDEVIADTGLPYWMELKAVSSGASAFGPAEMILLTEIKNVFGDGLTQPALQALNRMGIKSLLGQQDAFDILGDPSENLFTSQDQIKEATEETMAIMGSVQTGTVTFKILPISPDNDDHVTHLTQVHNPSAQEIIEQLDSGEVTPDKLDQLTEDILETRTNLILRLAALSAHIQQHQEALAIFGDKRADINQLREETNAILQSAEALLNNLQQNLRALQTKRDEKELRLRGMSPENEAERMKIEKELQELQLKQVEIQGKLSLSNKIADQKQQQHIDKQISKSRDRALKAQMHSDEMVMQSRLALEQNINKDALKNGQT